MQGLDKRLSIASGEVGRTQSRKNPSCTKEEIVAAVTELLTAKIMYRVAQMVQEPANGVLGHPPLTDEQRTELCAFMAEVGRQ